MPLKTENLYRFVIYLICLGNVLREGRRLGRREWGGGEEERREDRGERKRILC